MRTHVIITSLLVLCILNSCQKEFENPGDTVIPPASSTDTFRVNIDGVAFPTYAISAIAVMNNLPLKYDFQYASYTFGLFAGGEFHVLPSAPLAQNRLFIGSQALAAKM